MENDVREKTGMRHPCISCGRPGGVPSNGGLCDSCKVFGRGRRLGQSAFRAMLRLMDMR